MFKRLISRLQYNQMRRVEYWQLNNMSDAMLKDIGISRGEIKDRFYNQEKSQPLMRLVITLSLLCVSLLWHPLRLAAKVEVLDSGVQGKHRWLPNNIKLRVGDTSSDNKSKEFS